MRGLRGISRFGKGKTISLYERKRREERAKLSKKDKIAYFLIVLLGVLAFIISTVLLARPEKANAAVSFMDEGTETPTPHYYPDYNYYFILEESSTMGRKMVLSTEPFVGICDGTQDASGAYTIDLLAPGGNVKVVHYAYGVMAQDTDVFENCGNTPVLTFKYEGQDYETNKGFSCTGVTFHAQQNIAAATLSNMLTYLRSQNFDFEKYTDYVFLYHTTQNKYFLYLIEDWKVDLDAVEAGGYYYKYDEYFGEGSYFESMYACCGNIGDETYDVYKDSGNYFFAYRFIFYSSLFMKCDDFTPHPFPAYATLTGTGSGSSGDSSGGDSSGEIVTEAYDRLGFTPVPTKGRHIGIGLWNYNYAPCLGVVNSIGDMVIPNLRVSYRLVLPQKDKVQEWASNGYTKDSISTEDVVKWRKTKSGIKVDVMDFFSPVTCDKGYFALNLAEAIENVWSATYGDIDSSLADVVEQYAYADVVVTSAAYLEYGVRIYGPIAVNMASSFSDDGREVYYGDTYYLQSGHASNIAAYIEQIEITEDREDDINDWLASEEYKAALKENEELKNKVTELEDKLANMGESDGGVWATFENIAEGLKNASEGFKAVGKVIGNCLSFLPAEISAMMIFGISALIVIAIYWAVRGK